MSIRDNAERTVWLKILNVVLNKDASWVVLYCKKHNVEYGFDCMYGGEGDCGLTNTVWVTMSNYQESVKIILDGIEEKQRGINSEQD